MATLLTSLGTTDLVVGLTGSEVVTTLHFVAVTRAPAHVRARSRG